MRRWLSLTTFFTAIVLALPPWASGKARVDRSGKVERGKYLVRGVAMCGDCHSPHDEKGEPVPGQELHGAALRFEPAVQMPWAPAAPTIAGGPKGWTDAALVTLLTTGRGRDGKTLSPPMPQYRLSRQDAEDVVAYVRSLVPPREVAEQK